MKVGVTFNISEYGRDLLRIYSEKLELSRGEVVAKLLDQYNDEFNAYEYSALLVARPRKEQRRGAPSFYPKTRGKTTGIYLLESHKDKLDFQAYQLFMSRGDYVDLLLRTALKNMETQLLTTTEITPQLEEAANLVFAAYKQGKLNDYA